MKKLYLITLCCILVNFFAEGQITINFDAPSINQITDSTLSIRALVYSPYQVNTVIATVSGRQTSLVYNSATKFLEGSLSLAGLPQDTLLLQITVTDVFNNQKIATRTFIYDLKPVITVDLPVNFTVARPYIRIKASCKDNTPGSYLTVNWTKTGFSARSPLDTVIDLSNVYGGPTLLDIAAFDSRGQVSMEILHIYVDVSPALKELYTAGDKIIDFNYSKLFTAKGKLSNYNNLSYSLQMYYSDFKLVNITDNSETPIPFAGNVNYVQFRGYGPYPPLPDTGKSFDAYVKPYGAIFPGFDSLNKNNNLYELNGNVVNKLNSPSAYGVQEIKSAGKLTAWSDSLYYLKVRDGNTNTTKKVLLPNIHTIDLAENGTIAFSGNSYSSIDVGKYQNDSIVMITDPNVSKLADEALTDGNRVIFRQTNSLNGSSGYFIKLYDGTSTIDLANTGTKRPEANLQYQINKKFIAYSKIGSSGQFQLWLRDSAGIDKQITFFGTDVKLEKLGENGEMMFVNNFKRYWADKNGVLKQISPSQFGTPYQYNNQWYLTIGRTLFGVDINGTSNRVVDFQKNLPRNKTLDIDVTGFSPYFQGDGTLMSINISKLPAHGQLKLNGAAITLNTPIPRMGYNSPNTITYIPAAGFVGKDTIRWNGSNGIDFTPADALLIYNVTDSLPLTPVVTGIQTNYCVAAGVQKAKITNLPLQGSRTTAAVTLDAVVLPVAADSTFGFDPASMSTGVHRLLISFVNSSGTDSVVYNITITANITPDVNLSANITNIVNPSTIVTITASNAAGGGTLPLFTFSKDRNFTNIVQAESGSPAYSVNTGSWPMGDNWIYVRMKSNAACYTTPTGIDSIRLYKLLVPDKPVITGLSNKYCGGASLQKIKIVNLPAANYVTTATAKLDGITALTIGADTTIAIQPSLIAAGSHTLVIVFTNATGSNSTTVNFSITQASTPDVNLGANITTIVNPNDPVVITATNAAGGGTAPKYTFAKDKAFTNIIQAESSSATVTIQPNTLTSATNNIYVLMKTSDTCFTSQTGIDSISIERSAVTGITDTDFPNQVINVYPNPFAGDITISGLNTGKQYTINLGNANGQKVYSQQVNNSRTITISKTGLQSGKYWLSIYDTRKHQLIGTALLIKE